MSACAPRDAGHRFVSKRRVVLLASVASISAGMLFAEFALPSNSTGRAVFAPTYARAQNVQRPVGVAHIVVNVNPTLIYV